jgi:hypothetical protein
MRVSREWRHLQLLMKNGFGHDDSKSPGNGDLALFCPACPQPGINLPENWKKDPNQSVTTFSGIISLGLLTMSEDGSIAGPLWLMATSQLST